MHRVARFAFAMTTTIALCACPTGKSAKKSGTATTAPASKAREVDPAALCQVHTDVVSARYTGRVAALHKAYEAKSTGTTTDARAATFGSILTESTLKKAWAGFRDENAARPGTLLFSLGECLVYSEWKMDDQAPPRCAAAKEAQPGLAIADVGLATLWLAKGNHDKAIAAADLAIATDSKCASAYATKAQALAAKKDVDAAIAAYDASLVAKPDCFSCAAERAILIEQKEDLAAASVAWEKAFSIVADHAPSLERYAAVQVGRDDDKALAAYEKAIAGGQASYATLLAAAQLASRTEAILKAIDYGERAARMEPDHVDQWRLLAALYTKRDETEAIEKAFEEVLRLSPGDHSAHLSLARLSAKEERFVDAINHYAAATLAAPAAEDVPATELHALGVAEEKALQEKLHIVAAVTGAPEVVQDRVRRTVQDLFKSRHKPGTKGKIVVTVKTFKSGDVEEANILEDTLKDPYVTASLLGNLKRAKIGGGRKLYEFEYGFQ